MEEDHRTPADRARGGVIPAAHGEKVMNGDAYEQERLRRLPGGGT
jgi:hypothetical protein